MGGRPPEVERRPTTVGDETRGRDGTGTARWELSRRPSSEKRRVSLIRGSLPVHSLYRRPNYYFLIFNLVNTLLWVSKGLSWGGVVGCPPSLPPVYSPCPLPLVIKAVRVTWDNRLRALRRPSGVQIKCLPLWFRVSPGFKEFLRTDGSPPQTRPRAPPARFRKRKSIWWRPCPQGKDGTQRLISFRDSGSQTKDVEKR